MTNNLDKKWFVYMIIADDSSLYTGITTDIKARFNAHKNKKGAKYFYSRKPIKIIFHEEHPNRSIASKREFFIKKLTRLQKIELIQNNKAINNNMLQ